jgi:hypothetical protein
MYLNQPLGIDMSIKQQTNNPKGRPKGSPNKSTAMAREAIAQFVEGNAHKMQEWLEQVAIGVKNDDDKFIVLPNPEKAFGMLQSVMEYHLPKLARTEHSGDEEQPVKIIHEHKFLD